MKTLEFKGTPGPWKHQPSLSKPDAINIVGTILGGKYKIARVPFMIEQDGITKELASKLKAEALADAKLIAAAPELLIALQDMVSSFEYNDLNQKCIKEQAKAAIHKALGED